MFLNLDLLSSAAIIPPTVSSSEQLRTAPLKVGQLLCQQAALEKLAQISESAREGTLMVVTISNVHGKRFHRSKRACLPSGKFIALHVYDERSWKVPG
jgi:hypothetical protein